MTKSTEEQPVAASEEAKRAGEILRRWCRVEPIVCTMRMLIALEHGGKGEFLAEHVLYSLKTAREQACDSPSR
jgi:hypothetical protein